MAIKSTIFKADLTVADMDRNYYANHALTLARHPSETDERMMLRVLAFALHAHEALAFANGISADDEPDLWHKDLTGAIELWIDVGQPDEKLVRRACGRSRQVVIYNYGGKVAAMWWEQVRDKLDRTHNLTVMHVALDTSKALAKLAQRTMQLHCTIQDEHIWFSDAADTVAVDIVTIRANLTAHSTNHGA